VRQSKAIFFSVAIHYNSNSKFKNEYLTDKSGAAEFELGFVLLATDSIWLAEVA
jgi:hypothetical protein